MRPQQSRLTKNALIYPPNGCFSNNATPPPSDKEGILTREEFEASQCQQRFVEHVNRHVVVVVAQFVVVHIRFQVFKRTMSVVVAAAVVVDEFTVDI